MEKKTKLSRKLHGIKMLLLDVDGVLTDGGLYYSARGVEMKRFNSQDGYGVVRAHEHGLKIGIVSGRSTPIVAARAKDLAVEEIVQGSKDKLAAMNVIRHRHSLERREIGFIGDELFDIPLLKTVGLSAAPPNALREVRRSVHYVTRAAGGEGAVRDFIDFILDRRGR